MQGWEMGLVKSRNCTDDPTSPLGWRNKQTPTPRPGRAAVGAVRRASQPGVREQRLCKHRGTRRGLGWGAMLVGDGGGL